MQTRVSLRLVLGAVIAAGIAGPALAQSVTLRAADSLPPGHPIIVDGLTFWANRVKELTGGRFAIQHYPAQQLGKAPEMLRLAQSGVADITYVGPGYISDRLPLSDVAALPALITEACPGTKAFLALATDGGILAKEEYAPNGVKVLLAATLPAYQIFATNRPINGLADLKGMKIRSGGGSNDLMIAALGGVPIKVPAPEIMEVMQRGTVDANMGPYTSQTTYGFMALEKFATHGAPLGSFVTSYVIQQRKWDSLAPDIRAAMQKAADEANEHLCAVLQADELRSVDVMEKAGIKLLRTTPEMKAQIETVAAGVHERWTADMDSRGKPGKAVLAAFKEALATASK